MQEPKVTMARNFRLQTLKLTVPNLGARGYHCIPLQGIAVYQGLDSSNLKKNSRYQWKDLLIRKS